MTALAPPGSEDQVQFLLRMQRLLNEGQFTATYKYALLLALADIAVENGDDTGGALRVPIPRIAEKYVQYYWQQAVPYPVLAGEVIVLQQNTDRQAAILTKLVQLRQGYHTLSELRRDSVAWPQLLATVSGYFWQQPLWRLQRVGNEVLDFLYDNQEVGTRVKEIVLRPGVSFCLRRFHGLLSQSIRSSWLSHIRKLNGAALGTIADLEEFLFGSERNALSGIRPALRDLQQGKCFYCQGDLRQESNVDHFVPWSRYPVDLGHNFVLAHPGCNSTKGSLLAAEEHLGRWAERNRQFPQVIAEACERVRLRHDVVASGQITRWAYEQTEAARGVVWRRTSELVPLSPYWRSTLSA